MNLKATAHNIDRLAQQELPSYEKPTRNLEGKTTYQITRRTALNDNAARYEIIATTRGAQFAITDSGNYARVDIPATADEATITRLIATTRDAVRNIYNTSN